MRPRLADPVIHEKEVAVQIEITTSVVAGGQNVGTLVNSGIDPPDPVKPESSG